MSENRVLSIQSHVVHGYVGNKAAVFPLQLLGFEVDIVNSVHFSNHTGHPKGWEGDVLHGDQLRDLLDGLRRNDLLSNVRHVLTGYIGSESFTHAVVDVLRTLRQGDDDRGRPVRYVCDPVLGDHGKFYVPESLVGVFRDVLVPLADVVTPNQFEAERLTGIVSVRTMEHARRAARRLHDMGPSLVFITSMILEEDDDENGNNDDDDTICIFASRRRSKRDDDGREEEEEKEEMWRIDSPLLPGRFTGTGDLCAALLLAWSDRHPDDLPLVMEKVIGTMHAVLRRTVQHVDGDDTVASRELKLIQSKRDIEDPPRPFRATKVDP